MPDKPPDVEYRVTYNSTPARVRAEAYGARVAYGLGLDASEAVAAALALFAWAASKDEDPEYRLMKLTPDA